MIKKVKSTVLWKYAISDVNGEENVLCTRISKNKSNKIQDRKSN